MGQSILGADLLLRRAHGHLPRATPRYSGPSLGVLGLRIRLWGEKHPRPPCSAAILSMALGSRISQVLWRNQPVAASACGWISYSPVLPLSVPSTSPPPHPHPRKGWDGTLCPVVVLKTPCARRAHRDSRWAEGVAQGLGGAPQKRWEPQPCVRL